MLKLLTAATTKPVTPQKVKQRLRIDTSDDSEDLDVMIAAATAAVETHANLILQPSTWEYRLSTWPVWCGPTRFDGAAIFPFPAIKIPASPVRDVTAIRYVDADEAEQTIDPAGYQWERTKEGADIAFVSGFTLPTLSSNALQAVRVEFTAGFNDPADTGSGVDPDLALPPQAEMVLLFLIGHWYRSREPISIEHMVFPIPQTFEWLAAQIRVYR
jgi:uncharacterized phiE125 gp8 family phage protein